MDITDRLGKMPLRRVVIHKVFEEPWRLGTLLAGSQEGQIRLLDISDGELRMQTDFRYMASSRTYTIGGLIGLEDYAGISDILGMERRFISVLPVAKEQVRSLLDTHGIQPKDDGGFLSFGYGRFIDGTGSIFIYQSNEYRPPADDEMDDAARLLQEEVALASVSLAGLYDSLQALVMSRQYDVHRAMAGHIGTMVGTSEDLIARFLDPCVSSALACDLEGARKGDSILGIEAEAMEYVLQ
jgi:hypothetical protein